MLSAACNVFRSSALPSQARHTAAVLTPGSQHLASTAPLWADGTGYLYHHLLTIWLKTSSRKTIIILGFLWR